MKLPGVISLRNDFPIWAMPKGSFFRMDCCTLSKFTKMPCAVSGRSHATDAVSSAGPTKVLNMRLNFRGGPSFCSPQCGHGPSTPFGSSSSRKRCRQPAHSTSGSVKFSTWPEASQTRGCMRIAASRPTMSSRSWTIERHHARLTLFFSSTPSGPKSQVEPAPP